MSKHCFAWPIYTTPIRTIKGFGFSIFHKSRLPIKMVRITPVVALVACSTAVRGFMAESTTDAGAIDIGEFRSMDAFCKSYNSFKMSKTF